MTEDKYRQFSIYAIVSGIIIHIIYWNTLSASPLLYFISSIILSAGFFANLSLKGYKPFKVKTFYFMVILVLLLPIVGPIAAIVQLRLITKAGETIDASHKKRLTWLRNSLILLFIVGVFMISLPPFLAYRKLAERARHIESARAYIGEAKSLKEAGNSLFKEKVKEAFKELDEASSPKFSVGSSISDKIYALKGEAYYLGGEIELAYKSYEEALKSFSGNEEYKKRRDEIKKVIRKPDYSNDNK